MKNHPVYDHLKSGGYDDVTQAAKLARTALKLSWPKVKFSVRTERFAGGTAMRIGWVDGPTGKMVDEILAPLSGKGFDGMIDYAYYKSTWVFPNGTFMRAGSGGSACAGGLHEGFKTEKPKGDPEKADFGCWLTTSRTNSKEALQHTLDEYEREWDNPITEAIKSGDVFVKTTPYGSHWIDGAGQLYDNKQGFGPWGDQILQRITSSHTFEKVAA